jgi:hypothetical protein
MEDYPKAKTIEVPERCCSTLSPSRIPAIVTYPYHDLPTTSKAIDAMVDSLLSQAPPSPSRYGGGQTYE